MRVNDNLPNTPEEVSSEYLKRRKELKELEDNPVQTGNRMNAVLAEVPRLRAIEEAAYQPSEGEYGIITEPIFDDDGEFLGVIQDIDDRFLTAEERLARKEVNRLRGRPTWLETRLGFLRILAVAEGISLEDVEIDTIKLKPGRKGDPKIAERREIVRKHIERRRDFEVRSKLEQLFREFDERGIPEPENTDTKTPLFVGPWVQVLSQPGLRRRIVELLNRDRWRR